MTDNANEAAKDREAMANEHENMGGDRAAYLAGWDASAYKLPLLAGKAAYPEDSTARASFIRGFMDEDHGGG